MHLQEQTLFAQKQKEWNVADRRLASKFGIRDAETMLPFENDTTVTTSNPDDNDDSKESPSARYIGSSDFIEIKIDDQTFVTRRGTLTQVKGSVLETLFDAQIGRLEPDNNGVYYLDANPDAFKQVEFILS